jgi:hypothetical protein
MKGRFCTPKNIYPCKNGVEKKIYQNGKLPKNRHFGKKAN